VYVEGRGEGEAGRLHKKWALAFSFAKLLAFS